MASKFDVKRKNCFFMLNYFPKILAKKAFGFYVIALVLVSVLFMDYAMKAMFVVAGFLLVGAFFFGSNALSTSWRGISERRFLKNLFWTAFALRMAWVVFSYFFYRAQTGIPFEWDTADALGYHEAARWLSGLSFPQVFDYLFGSRNGYSDSGYPLYLTVLYKLVGPSILVPRVLKAVLGAYTCVLAYRLSQRNFGAPVARLGAIFCMLMPNMIYYCGLHLKEIEMTFLTVLFLERADLLLRSVKMKAGDLLLAFFAVGSLFLFRTALGIVALLAFFTALVFAPQRKQFKGRKVVLALFWIVCVATLAFGVFSTEVETLWENKDVNQALKRSEQTSRGNEWAQYATATVMAPLAFVVPFATMVDVSEQYAQQLIHGGAFVKNFMGVFVLLALFYVLKNKKWRDFAFVGAFVVGYLLVISASGFSNSERFHFPALPVLSLFWAFGLTKLNAKNLRFVNVWCCVVVVMELGWAVFKLGSRGLVSF